PPAEMTPPSGLKACTSSSLLGSTNEPGRLSKEPGEVEGAADGVADPPVVVAATDVSRRGPGGRPESRPLVSTRTRTTGLGPTTSGVGFSADPDRPSVTVYAGGAPGQLTRRVYVPAASWNGSGGLQGS